MQSLDVMSMNDIDEQIQIDERNGGEHSPCYSNIGIGNVVCRSIKTVVLSKKFNMLIPFGPVAILVQKWSGHNGWVFILGLLGIMPLAERLGYTTEQLAFYSGPTVGGLLNATFGNATELIISIYALRIGKIRVVQLSLLGSLLSNLLFVLGCAFLSGGLVNKEQLFNKATAVVNSGLLLMAVMGLVFPAFLHSTHSEVHFGISELALSRFSSCVMLPAYLASIFFQLNNLNDLEGILVGHNSDHEEEEETPEISKWESVIWLAIMAAAISILSEYLVDAIEGASLAWGVPVAFISVILLPIGGNTAAVTTSVMFAMKNKLDVSLGVAIGSSTQISMFLIPFCVVVGWIFGRPVDLNFGLFETATLFMTVIFVAFLMQMGSLDDRPMHDLDVECLYSPEMDAQKTQSNDSVQQVSLPGRLPVGDTKMIRNGVYKSIKTVVFSNKLNLLMPFGPLAILVHKMTAHNGWVFFLSLLGITPLAERLGYATEQLAFFTGPTVGGLLNATFGNATELIISIYALKSGMIRVVQLSLLGSILSNMLLVLGCAFFCGGLVYHGKEQVFSKATAVVNSGLLLMAVMGLLFPAVLHYTHTERHAGKSELALSRFSSCIMLLAYAAYLVFQLKSQKDLYVPIDEEGSQNEENSDDDDEAPEISKWESVIWLAIMTVWISILSDYLVDAIQGASEAWDVPIAFISVILLPIIGNAAEHASAIMFAMKDKLDISLGVAIGSSTQISMFGITLGVSSKHSRICHILIIALSCLVDAADSILCGDWVDDGARNGPKLPAF
ncbi:Calcium/proton exchanger [Corchorus capsularis]|uniref:Calcium/proton exchanger n=1 Tax=Corchorus capsularis TaxID=210143 RepID=A0A1R3IMN4_COCAP|nr:Calcium/proton exchanger [Corchorus capsularis]